MSHMRPRPQLQPLYQTPSPNDQVILYEGEIELFQGEKFVGTKGVVRLSWFPRMRIELEVATYPAVQFSLGPARTILGRVMLSAEIHIKKRISRSNETTLVARTERVGPTNAHDDVHTLLVHFANLPALPGELITDGYSVWAGGLSLESAPWSVKLDSMSHIGQLTRAMDEDGGYALTHCARLVRADGKPFSRAAAGNVLGALASLLAFEVGTPMPPLLLVGLDETGRREWEEWRTYEIEPWPERSQSQLPTTAVDRISSLFPGFVRRWAQGEGHSAELERLIGLYVDARSERLPYLSLITAQAGLELLASLHPTRRRSPYRGFAGKLTDLLSAAKASDGIPSDLQVLAEFAATEGVDNGPTAITRTRNMLVHSSGTKLAVASGQTNQAAALAIDYLRRLILYHFAYSERTARDHGGEFTAGGDEV